ncbi:MAG: ATP-binding cassette domain-containing protein, partial [Thiotrichales bacterium]|nr:ATP-binding cassette domain-containing protein [Thiotrichales bacterium]
MALNFDENAPVLEIKDLNLSYWTRAGEIPAVIDFSLTVQKGESIGLVGESGCGKSTVAMAIMQYMGGNGSIKSGSIRFKGVELTEPPPDELRTLRGSHISMIY